MNKDCEKDNENSSDVISKLKMDSNNHKKDVETYDELLASYRKIRATNTINFKVKKAGDTEETDVIGVSTYDDTEAALRSQDVKFRDKVLEIIDNDVKSRNSLRNKLLIFYMCFISVVTVATFWILIDPMAIARNRESYYPLSLKITMASTFMINLIAILVIMVKYAFTSSMENNILQHFDEIGFHKESKKI